MEQVKIRCGNKRAGTIAEAARTAGSAGWPRQPSRSDQSPETHGQISRKRGTHVEAQDGHANHPEVIKVRKPKGALNPTSPITLSLCNPTF
jgi:hypothetical protein